MAQEPSVAILIPAYNAADFLPRVLPAARQTAGDAPVLVIDPASTDGSADVAEALGATVIRLPERCGPALARNIGASQVTSDVLLFIDSDCVPRLDVVKRVREAFAADPDLVSLTGSYDDSPPQRGFFSQYMNLRHHHTHQGAQRDPATFWAGCGAVRRDVFLELGGFDAERYPSPQIEDIELGLRLGERGHTRLDPDLQVTHLKHWTLRSVVETDIFARGLPWSRLILERGALPNDLNLRSSQRLAALVAPLALIALVSAPVAWLAGRTAVLAACIALIALSVGLQLPMLRSFARLRGLPFAAGAWLFHQVHLFYSGVTFTLCWLRYRTWSSWNRSS